MTTFLDFEKPIAELEGKIKELTHLASNDDSNKEIANLESKVDQTLRQVYDKLSPWQKVQVARHPERPHFLDYVNILINGYVPLAGDRSFGDDKALLGGLGLFRGCPVMVIGHEKGSDTKSRLRHNFGMSHPEGYRKAVRLMKLADRFGLPVLTFVDTTGAYPGVEAEERGQAESIARAVETCLAIEVPLVASIVGEGGSGGAMALAVGDRVLMMEHAIYSVISPEGCASILWRNPNKARDAADALKLTANDLRDLGVIDRIISEPLGGAHRDPRSAIVALGDAIEEELNFIAQSEDNSLRQLRREKFLAMGRQPIN